MSGEIEEPSFTNRSNDPLRVFLNSESAIKTGTHHYRFFLNIDAEYDAYDIYYHLRELQCSYSWYQINSTNNLLSLNGFDYHIPPGNYSAQQLVDTLNLVTAWNGITIQWELNTINGKVTALGSAVFSWGITTTAHQLLGFGSIPLQTAATFTSTQLVDISPVKALNFHLLSVPARSFAVYNSQEITRHVCTIFVGEELPYNNLSYKDETSFSESTLQNVLRTIEVLVYDQNGIPVDLQNGTFQMLLEFTFRPKKVFRLFYS